MNSSAPVDQGVPALSGLLADWSINLPSLAGAAAIMLLGWFLARLARSGTSQLANYLNRVLDRSLRRGDMATARVPGSAHGMIGNVIFWTVLIFAGVLAARVAGVTLFAAWIDSAVTHFPHLVIGVTIIFAGWAVAARLGPRDGSQDRHVRRLCQGLVVAASLVIGGEQIGIDMTLPVVFLGIAAGAAFLGLSIAFGLGANGYVSANLAGRVLARHLQPGMRIKLGEFEGELIEQTATHLVLDTHQGHVLAPLSGALDTAIVITHAAKVEPTDHE